MSQVVAVVRALPSLSAEQAAGLPRPRSFGGRQVAAMLAGVATLPALVAAEFLLTDPLTSDAWQTAVHFAVSVVPWALVLPWLRFLDIRPVPFFFGCLALGWIVGPVLVGRVVGRLLALPYRDWAVEHWHASRARRVPGRPEWTLVPASEAGPYHRPPGERTLRIGWSLTIVAAIPALTLDADGTSWPGRCWLALLAVMMLASWVSFRLDRRRLASAQRVVAKPDQPDDRQSGGQERQGQQ